DLVAAEDPVPVAEMVVLVVVRAVDRSAYLLLSLLRRTTIQPFRTTLYMEEPEDLEVKEEMVASEELEVWGVPEERSRGIGIMRWGKAVLEVKAETVATAAVVAAVVVVFLTAYTYTIIKRYLLMVLPMQLLWVSAVVVVQEAFH
ncbi:MAG TPA: hypothetical protein P5077_12515, partial [bacterium]|nr:hypothetical protein [bacterium]